MKQAVLLAVAVAALYASAAPPQSFVYDDELLIDKELAPRNAGDILHVFDEPHYGRLPYYRPLSRLTYLAQKSPTGDDPWTFRLFNALLIGMIVPAAYALMRSKPFDVGRAPALIAAALFAVHPAASSCVYPVVGRETLLATLFTIVCCLAWTRTGPTWRVAASAAFAAALLGKEQAVVAPLLLIALDLSTRRIRVVRYVPIAGILAVYFIARSFVLTGDGPGLAIIADPLGPLRSFAFAMQTAVAPTLELAYEPAWPEWLSVPRLLVACIVFGLLVTRIRLIPFWGAWFVLSLLPSANWVEQETLFDERYVFPALLGLFAGAATLASDRRVDRRVVGVLGSIAVVVAAGTSFQRATWWTDALGFHEQWVRTNPESPNARNGLGVALAKDGKLEQAIEHYAVALRLDESHVQVHNNFGLALAGLGRTDEARRHYDDAVLLKPDYAEAHFNLANLHAVAGRTDDAEKHYRLALDARADYTKALNNYGALLMNRGDDQEAARQFDAVLRLDPRHAKAHVNAGVLLARRGRFDEAIEHYRAALAVDPDYVDAHFDLAVALERLDRRDEARRSYEHALTLARSAGAESLISTIESRLAAFRGM